MVNFLKCDFFVLDFVNYGFLVAVAVALMMLMGLVIYLKHNELGCAHDAYLVAIGCKSYFKIVTNCIHCSIFTETKFDSFFVII